MTGKGFRAESLPHYIQNRYQVNRYFFMHNESLPFVSVIIPVFNDSIRLQLCLDALARQTYPVHLFEVIVVDNNPEKDTEIIRLAAQFNAVRAFYESRRGSYAARNLGIHQARGTVMAFTDSDCIPDPDWIEKGVSSLLKTPDCGLVAGKIRFFFKNPSDPTAAEIYDSLNLLKQEEYLKEYHFGATANVFTFKAVFAEVGLFNAQLQSGGDQEWGKRVFAAGFKQVYAEDVVISHPARSTLRELQKKTARVTEGNYYLSGLNSQPLSSFLRDTLREVKPHLRYLLEIFGDNRINGFWTKINYYFIYISLRYIRCWKRMELYFKNHFSY